MAIYLLIALLGILVLAAIGAGGWVLVVLAKSALARLTDRRREEKRRAALLELAGERGWAFEQEERLLEEFPSGLLQASDKVLGQPARRVATSRIVGAVGDDLPIPIEAGDYRVERDGEPAVCFSYVLARPPGAERRRLVVRRERRGDRLKAGLGWGDIDFESVEFNDRYWVAGNDKRFAYDVIHPRAMELLLDGEDTGHETGEGAPPDLLIHDGVLLVTSRGWGLGDERNFTLVGAGRAGFRWSPDELRDRVAWVTRFLALWPRHLAGASSVAVLGCWLPPW